jgi:50S ribosomal protein L16 3-hydroxylase
VFEKSASLSSLFEGELLEKFNESYKKGEFLFVPSLGSGASELFELPFLNSLSDLVNLWPEKINCYLPGIADEVNSQKLEKEEALTQFKKGRGLFFDDPNRFDVIIDHWLKSLHRDLGLSQLTYSRSLIYAISQGSGTATHFDQNINLVLQISGTKKWWLAKNEMVSNPMTRYTLGSTMDPELESYLEGNIISEMPSDAQEIELTPGSLLFLPRGMWHKTEALSDAISLNFTFSAPTWIDLLTSALRARLAQSDEWRRTANSVNDPLLVHEAAAEFDELLSEFKEEFMQIGACHILSMTEFNPDSDLPEGNPAP